MTPEYPVVGGTALRLIAITSPNFTLQDPAASPQPSWAILQSGLAYFFGLTISGGTLAGPDYVINSDGAFFYDGTPAAGNLVQSITAPADSGTDASGNAWIGGNVTYASDGLLAIQIVAGSFTAWTATSQAGPWTESSTVLVMENGVITLNATEIALNGGIPQSTPLTALNPVTGSTPETWHTITLDSGWSLLAAYAAPSYRLLPDGNLQLTGLADFGSSQTVSHFLNSGSPLPAAYRPATNKVFRATDQNTQRGAVQISPGGVIEFFAGSAAPARYCEIDATLPLNL